MAPVEAQIAHTLTPDEKVGLLISNHNMYIHCVRAVKNWSKNPTDFFLLVISSLRVLHKGKDIFTHAKYNKHKAPNPASSPPLAASKLRSLLELRI